MAMSRPLVRGSTGQAPQTSWFGGIVDRLNCLTPNDLSQLTAPGTNFAVNFTWVKPVGGAVISADYGNLWSPWLGCSFGAPTPAPDGSTANSALMQEDTSNGQHVLTCTVQRHLSVMAMGAWRLSGYFKYNGRRVVLRVFGGDDTGSNTGFQGCYAVFDLAGAQVGVGPTRFISVTIPGNCGFTPLDAQIVGVGNGWFRCNLDFGLTNQTSPNLTSQILLDNGTGTNPLAANPPTYTGNGTSGAYVWRTNLMPIGAYSLNSVTFFDDMTSLSTFDIHNTLAPGFNWYMGGNNPANFNWNETLTQPGSFTQLTPTVIRILKTTSSPVGITMSTAVPTAPNVFVGRTFAPPFLVEMNVAMRFDLSNPNGGIPLLWTISKESMGQSGLTPSSLVMPDYLNQINEIDFNAIDYNGQDMHYVDHIGAPTLWPNRAASQITAIADFGRGAFRGTPSWYSSWNYNVPQAAVVSGGVRYATTGAATGQPPGGTNWAADPYPPSTGSQVGGPAVAFDYTQFHTYSMLYLPYLGATDVPNTLPYITAGNTNQIPGNAVPAGTNSRCGQFIIFIDGLYSGANFSYTPFAANGAINTILRSEGNTYPIFYGGDTVPGWPGDLDWIRVTQ